MVFVVIQLVMDYAKNVLELDILACPVIVLLFPQDLIQLMSVRAI